MKMICPACGGHVKFAAQNIGQQIPCPHCRAAITLRQPDENLKMTCVLCGGHVEFPAACRRPKNPLPALRENHHAVKARITILPLWFYWSFGG